MEDNIKYCPILSIKGALKNDKLVLEECVEEKCGFWSEYFEQCGFANTGIAMNSEY